MIVGVAIVQILAPGIGRRRKPISTVVAFFVAIILVIVASSCRVYLGYHWPTDVLASISLSLTVLGGVIAVDTWRTVRVKASGG